MLSPDYWHGGSHSRTIGLGHVDWQEVPKRVRKMMIGTRRRINVRAEGYGQLKQY